MPSWSAPPSWAEVSVATCTRVPVSTVVAVVPESWCGGGGGRGDADGERQERQDGEAAGQANGHGRTFGHSWSHLQPVHLGGVSCLGETV